MSELEQTFHRMLNPEDKQDWRNEYIREIWGSDAGKYLAYKMMEMCDYWHKDISRGDWFDGMRYMIDQIFMLDASPQDVIETITQGEKYGRDAN